ncbi:MAG: hypothetical protein K0R57_465 [Paenibacillaceae bacterium]|jgi:hypothetical protein|nr:hypothetical protein [Paenibacillaceae bacterium]
MIIKMKRLLTGLLAAALMALAVPVMPASAAPSPETAEIANPYIRVSVSKENGGYVISTVEGDILKKSDDDVDLTHRGANMDTSFTSFRIGSKDYVFGNDYGFLGTSSTGVQTSVDPAGAWVASTWSVNGIQVEQRITLVDSEVSEQLGTAMITYTVRNSGAAAESIQSRVLIDTQLGGKDYGYYELPKQNLGQGYEYFEFERSWDSKADSTIRMPADYFVRDNPYASGIVGFGVNSVFADDKPYKMTFAHWANIAATKFDYTPDTTLNFTNAINGSKTADSAVALYYDLGSIAAGAEKAFSTYYGVTANLKNKDNQVLINTTAPSKLSFKDAGRTAYAGTEGEDNVARINTTVTNPANSGKTYRNLAIVVYALGFDTQRQADDGSWIDYSNTDPLFTDVVAFAPGENRVTYFDFKFAPDVNAQLGSFVTKVFDMDEGVNELGSYAEEYCLGTTENFVILPGTNPELPAITLSELSPKILYNDETRYLTVMGQGMSFFRSDLLNKIELRGEDGTVYEAPIDSLTYEQGDKPTSASIQLDGYMDPGRYELHFVWKTGTGEQALQGVPEDFTSPAMTVHLSSDPQYRNDQYGVVTVQRDGADKYKAVPYKNEAAFTAANVGADDLLLTFRGDILQDNDDKNFYRMLGKDKNVNINQMLNYLGSDLTIKQYGNGTVVVKMDGKITTVGANTTVRDGTALFQLDAGTQYVVPVYDGRGEVKSGGSLNTKQDYIELQWDNAFDTLRTIGGFLIDLKYGVLGKIQEGGDGKKTYDIISFGGGLDLGFLTPGGAAKARQNTATGNKWTTDTEVIEDDDPDGFGFGLSFDDETGDITAQTKEKDVPPKNSKPSRVEAGVTIHDILYGGKDPGYVGINMDARLSLPQVVSFLPNKIEADLHVNTIGGYEVGFDGKVKTAMLEMMLSLVIKSNPSGAPIPDKLYFTIGGFEPGLNVDSLGVAWITGGGGGFDKLYDTIYGKDGLPPLTLLLHVEFDITKILSGSADLELSLRSIAISFDDLSLKKLKDAKFIDGGRIAIGWYPNFSLNLQAGVNYLQILKGSIRITAAAGDTTDDFVEFVLRVALGVPKYIPVVGGMEIASAELGGGSEKVWGNVTLLEIIKVGFVYYWGGDVEFTAGNAGGTDRFSAAPVPRGAGEMRTMALFSALTEPQPVQTDPSTGKTQFVAVGGNLSFAAGSKVAADFDALASDAMQPAEAMRSARAAANPTQIFTNNGRTSHLVQFGDAANYILTVSSVDGAEITAANLSKSMTVKQNGSPYALKYYAAPGAEATDGEKEAALKDANVNIAGGVAYIFIPGTALAADRNFLIEFAGNTAYDVGAIYVEPVSELTTYSADLNGQSLTVNWTGENLSDTAKLIVSVSDIRGEDGVILNTADIPAKYDGGSGAAVLAVPERLASGTYYVTVTLSDEGVCFEKYNANSITINNSKAPGVPKSVTLANAGNDKLQVSVTPPDGDFGGYFVDIYEDGVLADAGLYFEKGEEIIVGGRYEMPVMRTDDNGSPVLDNEGKPVQETENGVAKTAVVGYTPGKTYTAKVRVGNIEDHTPDVDGDEIYHCSEYIMSGGVVLAAATPPAVAVAYDKTTGEAAITADVPVTGELYVNSGIADGKWYELKPAGTALTQALNLPDGEHTLELHAVDADGDKIITSQIVKVDTTPPTLLMETPVSGGTFSGSTLAVRASADWDATYTFKINGTPIDQKSGSAIINGGLLSHTLPIGSYAGGAKLILEIEAADADGNTATKRIELNNAKLADVSGIAIYNGSTPVAGGEIKLDDIGDTAELRLMGIVPGEPGRPIDLTDSTGAAFEVLGGHSASLSGNKATARAAGQTMIRGSYELGGGRSLDDGAVLSVMDDNRPLPVTHTITATADAGGSISPSGNIMVSDGSSQSFTVAANSGYSIADVRIDGSSVGAVTGYTFTNVTGNHTIAAAFNRNGTGDGSGGGSDNGNGEESGTGGSSSGGGTAIDISAAAYDKASGKDIVVTLTPGNNTLITVNNGNATLVKGTDYTVSGNTVTIKKEYLVTLSPGEHRLTFDMSSGNDPILTLTIEDEIPQAEGVNPFQDVDKSAWYYGDVQYAYQKALFTGTSAATFSPDMPMTRGMLVTVLGRLAGVDTGKYPASSFDDVAVSRYYAAFVAWAKENGIVAGIDSNLFAPDADITRQDMAVILYRYMLFMNTGLPKVKEWLAFADDDHIAGYAREALYAMQQAGIIDGKPGNLADPQGQATRAEVAAMLHRFSEAIKEE